MSRKSEARDRKRANKKRRKRKKEELQARVGKKW